MPVRIEKAEALNKKTYLPPFDILKVVSQPLKGKNGGRYVNKESGH